jgi:hypothetical protein
MSNKRCPLEEQGSIFIFLKATRREKKGNRDDHWSCNRRRRSARERERERVAEDEPVGAE